jgi:hypothetical protein
MKDRSQLQKLCILSGARDDLEHVQILCDNLGLFSTNAEDRRVDAHQVQLNDLKAFITDEILETARRIKTARDVNENLP